MQVAGGAMHEFNGGVHRVIVTSSIRPPSSHPTSKIHYFNHKRFVNPNL
jgi:hypothetical protein